jgi:folate-dependent phosphoribosylglycinamide formyltransferase PurN
MESNEPRVVLLCGEGLSSVVMYNSLAGVVNVERVIMEARPSATRLISRRITRLGVFRTAGQLLFVVANKFAAKLSAKRIDQLLQRYALNRNAIPSHLVSKVSSINSEQAIDLLRQAKPDVVVVNGTRILSRDVLASVDVRFINTHMGITPKYRGVHGGYWALANGDLENCGVTVHLVDQGIDTGGVLYQQTIRPEQDDNFNTYPIHQLAAAIPLMRTAINDAVTSQVTVRPGVLPSRLWYHPTLFEYVRHWLIKGVK